MVLDWGAKTAGDREFSWFEVRNDMFNMLAALSSLLCRLLSIHFVASDTPSKCLLCVDLSDAFVRLFTARPMGPRSLFLLKRVLPGQRDRSERCYSSRMEFLNP